MDDSFDAPAFGNTFLLVKSQRREGKSGIPLASWDSRADESAGAYSTN